MLRDQARARLVEQTEREHRQTKCAFHPGEVQAPREPWGRVLEPSRQQSQRKEREEDAHAGVRAKERRHQQREESAESPSGSQEQQDQVRLGKEAREKRALAAKELGEQEQEAHAADQTERGGRLLDLRGAVVELLAHRAEGFQPVLRHRQQKRGEPQAVELRLDGPAVRAPHVSTVSREMHEAWRDVAGERQREHRRERQAGEQRANARASQR